VRTRDRARRLRSRRPARPHSRRARAPRPAARYCDRAFEANFGGARLDGSSGLHNGAGPAVHGHFFGQSSFATYSLATERNVVKVPRDVPLELLGPLGCSLQTGAGAVLNSLKVPAGASLAVFGSGAVGLAAIMAAKVAGAHPTVAVDVNLERLELARELGAGHVLDPRAVDLRDALAAILPGGLDFVLEITAVPEMLKTAVDVLAPLGTAALIGGAPQGTEAPVDMNKSTRSRRSTKPWPTRAAVPRSSRSSA
jgi:aryl-alcohol dehydrogenase